MEEGECEGPIVERIVENEGRIMNIGVVSEAQGSFNLNHTI